MKRKDYGGGDREEEKEEGRKERKGRSGEDRLCKGNKVEIDKSER